MTDRAKWADYVCRESKLSRLCVVRSDDHPDCDRQGKLSRLCRGRQGKMSRICVVRGRANWADYVLWKSTTAGLCKTGQTEQTMCCVRQVMCCERVRQLDRPNWADYVLWLNTSKKHVDEWRGTSYVRLARTEFVHTVYERIHGNFLAKNTVYTTYILMYACMVLANPIEMYNCRKNSIITGDAWIAFQCFGLT